MITPGTVPQFEDSNSERDYPLFVADGIPQDAFLDLRVFDRWPGLRSRPEITGWEEVSGSISVTVATGGFLRSDPMEVVEIQFLISPAKVAEAQERPVLVVAEPFFDPWIDNPETPYAGGSILVSRGITQIPTDFSWAWIEPTLSCGLGGTEISRLRIRKKNGDLVPVYGDVRLSSGHNTMLAAPNPRTLQILPVRGSGLGKQAPESWDDLSPSDLFPATLDWREAQEEVSELEISSFVRTINGAHPFPDGSFQVFGERGVQIINDPSNRAVRIGFFSPSASGALCPPQEPEPDPAPNE
jgi:hypothetical protein